MEVDDSRTTAGSVSMLETRLLCSKSEAVEVRMFSGGGIVSVCSQFKKKFYEQVFHQKITNTICKYRKAFSYTFVQKTACNML